ncbi:MAG TPA: methyltransferase domain-containing protein [Pyrinomonadaceae bacterium]|nr:methyltransferase domain-containing protein [Pyrinomonadaceae bacterium]
MSKVLDVIKWTVSRGSQPQNFLGARWIGWYLARTSPKKRRIKALRILAMSPHYFLDEANPKYANMSRDEYLEDAFNVLVDSREDMYQRILKPYLGQDDVVLDYGCGPGFISRVVAPRVKQVYSTDISSGALACARILNNPENVTYVLAEPESQKVIPDGGIDVIYSFAVIQHLTDEAFASVLEVCSRKLKSEGGKLVLHIQLTDDIWKTEDEHKADQSVQGRLKYGIGLHCFGRTLERHYELLEQHGFKVLDVVNLGDLVPEMADEVHSQRMLIATKA